MQLTQFVLAVSNWWSPANLISDHAQSNECIYTDNGVPVVDLGYSMYQPNFQNISGQYYNFSNIRYAAPPIGELRFRAPEPPVDERSMGIQDGSYGFNCPQSMARWVYSMDPNGNHINQTGNVTYEIPAHGSDENEDCLFLDVIVPKDVLTRKCSADSKNMSRAAPVLVWIFGGAYVMGSKALWGDPMGLITHNREAGREDFIFVAMNYRLGALGWLGGPSLESDGTLNAGLRDQSMAIEWVQKNIHLFGGDPDRVTLMGESAGGGSVLNHIVGTSPSSKAPFSQAIVQSPGLLPVVGNIEPESYLQEFLSILGVSSVSEAREMDSSVIIRANDEAVLTSSFGRFKFGPTFGSDDLPRTPGNILSKRDYNPNIKLLLGHCPNEGHQFTPDPSSEEEFEKFLSSFFPHADDAVLSYIAEELYPPVYDGSHPYQTIRERIDLLYSEFVFTCHTNHLSRAFVNATFNYRYNNSLGLHTDDVPATFMNGEKSWGWEEIKNKTAASALQEYITSFVVKGTPNDDKSKLVSPNFPMYGQESNLIDITSTDIKIIKDDTANHRCDWWQRSLYY